MVISHAKRSQHVTLSSCWAQINGPGLSRLRMPLTLQVCNCHQITLCTAHRRHIPSRYQLDRLLSTSSSLALDRIKDGCFNGNCRGHQKGIPYNEERVAPTTARQDRGISEDMRSLSLIAVLETLDSFNQE